MLLRQTTIKKEQHFSGVGIHSGKAVNITLKPAKEDAGIRFIRTDLEEAKPILAEVSNVVRTDMSVTLGNGVYTVSTVEHLLSALSALEINNLSIEVDGPELPILDGSSKVYIEALSTNIEEQSKKQLVYKIIKPVVVRKNDAFVYLLPADNFAVSCKIDFSHPSIGEQVYHMPKVDFLSYSRNISLAKTFGFEAQIRDLKARGLALGGSLENAIFLSNNYIVNPDKMSYEDEFVRHKILDLIGDMYLLGGKALIAHVVAYKSGHSLHTEAIRELLRTERFVLTTQPHKLRLVRKVWTLRDVIKKVF